MSHLLGRLVEYRAINEEGIEEQRTGRVVHASNEFLLVESRLGDLVWVDPARAHISTIQHRHPAGLRPVAYQWGGRTAEYKRGWLVGILGTADLASVIVETEDGQILELDTPAVRFMDRGQGLPAADSVSLALSV